MSGLVRIYGRKVSKPGELTFWRGQRLRLVRTQKESEPARGTHNLERAEVGTCLDTTRKQASKRHSHPGDFRMRSQVAGYK